MGKRLGASRRNFGNIVVEPAPFPQFTSGVGPVFFGTINVAKVVTSQRIMAF